ncbi:MAG: hypothetical protein ACON5H_03895 [Akkermansiaceae bacterium]
MPLLLGGSAFLLSCGEKKSDDAQETAETALSSTEGASEEVLKNGASVSTASGETEAIPDIALEEVAKVTGFAQNLPADIEGYLSLLKAGDSYDELRGTGLGQLLGEIAAEQGQDLEELNQGPGTQMARSILGEEFFIAFGKSSGVQGAKLQKLYKGYYNAIGMMMVKGMESEVTGDNDAMMNMMMNPLALLGEPKDVIADFETMKLPPVTIGMKVGDADIREQIYGIISGQFASAMEFGIPGFEELAFEKEGVQLTGVTIAGKPLAELMNEERDDAAQFLGGEEVFDKLRKAVASKNIHAATGILGDYILIYLGGDLEGFKLSRGVSDSLLGQKCNEFMKLYAKKDIRVLSFVEKGALTALADSTEILASMATGAKSALEDSEVFGDTRDIQTLLGHVAQVEGELMAMGTYEAQGWVGFVEEGFKVESHGGSSLPSLNFEKNHTFTSLAEQDDVLLYANTVANPEFSAKLDEYLRAITEASYLASKHFNGLDLDDPDYQEFKQGFEVFDQLAAKDLVEIWSAVTGDLTTGTGEESAVIIDLKGSMPKIPNVPEVAIDKGIAPRMAVILPVNDRAKIKSSWKRINTAVTNMIKNGHDAGMLPEEIVMQEVFKSQQAGLDTYNFQIPFTTQDSLPTVGLNDEIFIASTSQVLNSEIVSRLKQPHPVIRNGSYLKLNFAELREFAEAWLKLVEENQDAFFKRDYEKEDFVENLPMFKETLESLKELNSYTLHSRKIGGKVRTSHHFKTN